jgi:hypothetical protein
MTPPYLFLVLLWRAEQGIDLPTFADHLRTQLRDAPLPQHVIPAQAGIHTELATLTQHGFPLSRE